MLRDKKSEAASNVNSARKIEKKTTVVVNSKMKVDAGKQSESIVNSSNKVVKKPLLLTKNFV